MLVEADLAKFSPSKDTLLTIGVFDGVHLGHRHLVSQLLQQARQRDLLGGVVTFQQHPQEVLSGVKLPFLIGVAERVRLLQQEGVELVVVLQFTSELAGLSARQFVSLLKQYLRMRGLVVGADFTLGHNREGDIAGLNKLGEELDFTVTVVPPLIINGEIVSSTAIRKALTSGDMKKVARLAGRPFNLSGRVVTGSGRGQGLGFPTANLAVSPEQALPADGVYATWSYIDGRQYPSVTNIGHNPSFNGRKRTIEVYAIGYRGDLYGRDLKIDIIERLRSEKRFDTVDKLKEQIAEDVKYGQTVLSSRGDS
ncbi:MAG: bifunctional riboflavin kinase/FAD synthetase [Dehalococcoidales bacterium]|nr:bifunctional riboflavin kinase/FAD synthetase [Dehalococcoidales bacterium]